MMKTVITGSRVLFQGVLVKLLPNGKAAVRDGNTVKIGTLVTDKTELRHCNRRSTFTA